LRQMKSQQVILQRFGDEIQKCDLIMDAEPQVRILDLMRR